MNKTVILINLNKTKPNNYKLKRYYKLKIKENFKNRRKIINQKSFATKISMMIFYYFYTCNKLCKFKKITQLAPVNEKRFKSIHEYLI